MYRSIRNAADMKSGMGMMHHTIGLTLSYSFLG